MLYCSSTETCFHPLGIGIRKTSVGRAGAACAAAAGRWVWTGACCPGNCWVCSGGAVGFCVCNCGSGPAGAGLGLVCAHSAEPPIMRTMTITVRAMNMFSSLENEVHANRVRARPSCEVVADGFYTRAFDNPTPSAYRRHPPGSGSAVHASLYDWRSALRANPFPYLLFCCLLAIGADAALAAPVGLVQRASGDTWVYSRTERARHLNAGEAFESGVSITTGSKSSVGLRFKDGQIVVLASNATFRVKNFVFSPEQPDPGQVRFELAKGGMRSGTGIIGEEKCRSGARDRRCRHCRRGRRTGVLDHAPLRRNSRCETI